MFTAPGQFDKLIISASSLGEEIVRRSRLIIEQSNDLVDYAKHQENVMQGNFYLGIIPTIAPFVLGEFQTLCQQLYPDLALFIREDTTDNLLHYLGEGKLDLVILALPYPTHNFKTKVLCKDYFKLVLPEHWLHQGFEQEIDKLPQHSIFLLEKEHCLTEHALQACQLKDSQKINHFLHHSMKRRASDEQVLSELGRSLGIAKPHVFTWDMRHGNHGILLYDTDNECLCQADNELLHHIAALLGLCPV